VSTPSKPRALVIDGPCLLTVLADIQPGGLRDKMLQCTQICKSVVCCRVSPDQKREIVLLVKGMVVMFVGCTFTVQIRWCVDHVELMRLA
jgi:magnesium-transporting ATPase (P-type)